jgi:hypothetical protein
MASQVNLTWPNSSSCPAHLFPFLPTTPSPFFPPLPPQPMQSTQSPQPKSPTQANNQETPANGECVTLAEHALALVFAGSGRRAGFLLAE